jgi:AraC family transcriptional regulator
VEWLAKMNNAIDFIETNIKRKIDYAEAASIACCSLTRFQRVFQFVTDVTVAEYVRCRRMSLAAAELLNRDIKIVDLALEYGYESPEAFSRAFQAFHGISPTSVRKLGIHTDYHRISFQITMNGGSFTMGTKPLVRIEEHSKERVVSFFVNCSGPEGAAWGLLRDWAMANLQDYPARRYIGCAPKGHHPKGEAHRPDEEPGTHEYLAQMLLFEHEGDDETFLGADVCDAPIGLFLVGDVVLNEFSDDGTIDIGSSMQKAFGVMAECLSDMGGYEFELKERPYIEEHIFTKEWFAGDEGLAGFKLWLPIRKV